MSTKHEPEQLVPGTIVVDNNAAVPTDSDYLVKAAIDNNAAWGVVFDLNQQRPEGPPEKPEEPPPPEIPDPESDWIGERRSQEGINLPHSRYQSPDLTFVDPSDHEEPYEAFIERDRQLVAQAVRR